MRRSAAGILPILTLIALSACSASSPSDVTDSDALAHQSHSQAAEFSAELQASTNKRLHWSDTNAWSDDQLQSGKAPSSGDIVVERDQILLLDQNLAVDSLTINGQVECASQDLNISADWIMVHGNFVCGTPDAPYTHQLDITLNGNDRTASVMGMGTKMLSAMGGGRIWLHGEARTSWLMLDETVRPGSDTLVLEQAPDWRVGDWIVITATGDDMEEAEVRQITTIDGRHLVLNKGLFHTHFGEIQTFSNGQRTWTADTRAEVALLSRNIRIQGDEQSESTRFGGHVMIMQGSEGLFSGVEMNRMGQEGILGRYPFHWHLAGDVGGQYIRHSSIRRSYNRCVTVHGSHNALVQDNVCMDHIGHGYFLEDGGETGNVFDHNLGLLTRKPARDMALIPSDIETGQAARGPSTFWISNGDNVFTGNAAAGSDGLGFWYDTDEQVTGASASLARYANVSPLTSPFGKFSDNRVHSSNMGFSSCEAGQGAEGYLPPNQAHIENLTVFTGGDGAVWPCKGNQLFTNLVLTDSGHARKAAFVAPRPVTIRDSLFVANSSLSAEGIGRQRSAIGIYDFGVIFENVHFVNYNDDYGPSYLFGARDAANRLTSGRVSGVSYDNSFNLYDRRKSIDELRPSQWGAVIHDLDGSLGLAPNTALVADHPMMVDDTCTAPIGTGRLCDNRYGWVRLDFRKTTRLPPIKHTRSDGLRFTVNPLEPRSSYQSVVSVNHDRHYYGYEFDQKLFDIGRLNILLAYLHQGDTVTLELKSMPASATILDRDYTLAASLADLRQGPGKRYIRIADSLFVKMQAEGKSWEASDYMSIVW
ncbi:G8 domain-containing protein [Granulosicoccus sp. 3-233]|uniref:G8 domain-containing protein n=1 Tax=Granulosicoccus sp. 3-233 TaxID=3417969 RepID=UPI003D356580